MKPTPRNRIDRRTFIATSAVAALAGCTGSGEDSTTTETTGTESGGSDTTTASPSGAGAQTTARKSASVEVGELVADDSLAMVVRGIEKTGKLGEYQEAEAGNTFVVIEMAVKNKASTEFVDFSSFWQTRLKDGANHVYDQTFAVTDNPMQSGQLAPGEVSRGTVVYEVPTDASGLTLQFDFSAFDFFSFDRVTVDLGSTARSIADLSQDLEVPIHQPGDAVKKHGVAVTLNGVRTETELGPYTKAEDGMEYVIPDVSVKNATGEPLNVSISLQMIAKDGIGRAYTVDIGSYSQLDQKFAQGSELGAGATRRGELSYAVPTDTETLYWAFEFSLLADGDKTFWSLSS